MKVLMIWCRRQIQLFYANCSISNNPSMLGYIFCVIDCLSGISLKGTLIAWPFANVNLRKMKANSYAFIWLLEMHSVLDHAKYAEDQLSQLFALPPFLKQETYVWLPFLFQLHKPGLDKMLSLYRHL